MSEKEVLVVKDVEHLYKEWYLDYASYVILDRAIPHILDGLKPVQRRILFAMKEMDDGRFHKVANIIGQTMQYHPHGDASISEAMVLMGQKDLFIETQGNWGDVRTKDKAAAPRYIEARLSKFALAVLFNAQTTEWIATYDGRKKEPLTLPAKFPILLAQGADNIAVGLSTRILPHNFRELIEAAIKYLKGHTFTLYPDFPTGANIDVSLYNDGLKGKIRCRATIEEVDAKTLLIKDVPYGVSTESLCDSIVKANEKGVIKVKKITDNTAKDVAIQIDLQAGIATGMTIEALYAFTQCEVSISVNACVIDGDKPAFMGVSDILKRSVAHTQVLLEKELQIKRATLMEELFFLSLEEIFITHKIYTLIEEEISWEGILVAIAQGIAPYTQKLIRKVEEADIVRLTEIKIKRISRFDAGKAHDQMVALRERIQQTEYHLAHITDYTIAHFTTLMEHYGKHRKRRTKVATFATVDAKRVAVAYMKIFMQRVAGFIGTSLKKDELIDLCSDLDVIIVFRKDGKMIVTKVAEKTFVGKDILYAAVFKAKDERTIYHMIYVEGHSGDVYAKRFFVSGITRDKEYALCKEHPKTKVLYFSANKQGTEEQVEIVLSPNCAARQKTFLFSFSTIEVKNRSALGIRITRYAVRKIQFKAKEATYEAFPLYYDTFLCKFTHTSSLTTRNLGQIHIKDSVLALFSDGKIALFTPDYPHIVDTGTLLFLEIYTPQSALTIVYQEEGKGAYFAKCFYVEEGLTLNQKYPICKGNIQVILVTQAPNPILIVEGKDKEKRRFVKEIPLYELTSPSFMRQVGVKLMDAQKVKMKWKIV